MSGGGGADGETHGFVFDGRRRRRRSACFFFFFQLRFSIFSRPASKGQRDLLCSLSLTFACGLRRFTRSREKKRGRVDENAKSEPVSFLMSGSREPRAANGRAFLFFFFFSTSTSTPSPSTTTLLPFDLTPSSTPHSSLPPPKKTRQALRLRPGDPPYPGRARAEAEQDQPPRGPPELPGEELEKERKKRGSWRKKEKREDEGGAAFGSRARPLSLHLARPSSLFLFLAPSDPRFRACVLVFASHCGGILEELARGGGIKSGAKF